MVAVVPAKLIRLTPIPVKLSIVAPTPIRVEDFATPTPETMLVRFAPLPK